MRVGRGNHKRGTDIGKSFKALRVAKSQALVGFNTCTGCDQTRKFNDYAKQSCWSTFIRSSRKVPKQSLRDAL